MPAKITKEIYEQRISERFPEQEYEILSFNGITNPLKIKCLKCGRELSFSDGNSCLRNKNGICRKCYDNPVHNQPISQEELQHRLDNFYGENRYLIIESNGVRNPLKIKCLKCGTIIERQSFSHIERENELCKNCRDLSDSLETIQSKINLRFGEDEFEVLKFDKKTNKLTVKHKCGFIRTMDRARFYERGLCPQCDKATSAGEADVARFLTKKKIPYQTQKTYNDLLSENGKYLRFDFCVDDKFIIEYNGMQHYKPIDHFGGEETFKKTVLHDSMKEEYCKRNNIPYLIIPYWQDKKKESMIISFLKCNDYPIEE